MSFTIFLAGTDIIFKTLQRSSLILPQYEGVFSKFIGFFRDIMSVKENLKFAHLQDTGEFISDYNGPFFISRDRVVGFIR